MKKDIKWLAAAAIIFLIFGFMYLTVEQSQRNDANYPQIQLAEDGAYQLNLGAQPSSLTEGRIDMASSLAAFTIIYDKSGKVVAGNGYLNNRIPVPPVGVLTSSNNKNYSFVSWQPASNVRVAAVTAQADNFYILSGRSLKEVEKNEHRTFLFALTGGILSELVLAGAFIVTRL